MFREVLKVSGMIDALIESQQAEHRWSSEGKEEWCRWLMCVCCYSLCICVRYTYSPLLQLYSVYGTRSQSFVQGLITAQHSRCHKHLLLRYEYTRCSKSRRVRGYPLLTLYLLYTPTSTRTLDNKQATSNVIQSSR